MDLIYNGRQAIVALNRVNKISRLSETIKYDANLEKDVKIIFILGESTRADRLSINGYKKETTPNLQLLLKNPLFLNFGTIQSCASFTFLSTMCMFSRMTAFSNDSNPTES